MNWIGSILLVAGGVLCVCAALILLAICQAYRFFIRRDHSRRVRLPAIAAFACESSVVHGEPLHVCVHTTRSASARLMRLGAECDEVDWSCRVPISRQSPQYHAWRGFDWQANLTIDTASLEPDVYLLVVRQDDDPLSSYRVPLIVKPKRAPSIAVVASTNTWQAYNDFGGLSNYRDQLTPWPLRWLIQCGKILNARVLIGDYKFIPAVPLPWARPNDAIDADMQQPLACPIQRPSHLLRAEWALLRYLNQQGREFGVYSDADLARDPQLNHVQLLIFNTHSEYWSEEMLGRLNAHLHRGGRAMFLSGNNQYRRVQFLENGLAVVDFRADRQQTAEMLGAAYDALGYQSYAGYTVAEASHWAFAGLGVRDGQLFAGQRPSRGEMATLGASGFETDKMTAHSRDVTLLAIGANQVGGAHMVLKASPGGGWVFNTGSVATTAWIGLDRILSRLVSNVIDKALEPSGISQSVRAA